MNCDGFKEFKNINSYFQKYEIYLPTELVQLIAAKSQ